VRSALPQAHMYFVERRHRVAGLGLERRKSTGDFRRSNVVQGSGPDSRPGNSEVELTSELEPASAIAVASNLPEIAVLYVGVRAAQ
jgi:hypothetical protein